MRNITVNDLINLFTGMLPAGTPVATTYMEADDGDPESLSLGAAWPSDIDGLPTRTAYAEVAFFHPYPEITWVCVNPDESFTIGLPCQGGVVWEDSGVANLSEVGIPTDPNQLYFQAKQALVQQGCPADRFSVVIGTIDDQGNLFDLG